MSTPGEQEEFPRGAQAKSFKEMKFPDPQVAPVVFSKSSVAKLSQLSCPLCPIVFSYLTFLSLLL